MPQQPTLILLISLCLSLPAKADWLWLDRNLQTQPIQLARLTTNTLATINTDTGDIDTIATNEVVRLSRQFPTTTDLPDPDAPTITLVDGQTLTASLRPDADGQTFIIDHQQLGRLLIPLNRIASLTWHRQNQTAPAPTNLSRDLIQLANGDQLEATLLALFDQSARLLLPGNPQPIDLPLAAIQTIHRAHEPATPTLADQITLTTGETIHANRVTFQQSTWTLTPTLAISTVQLSEDAINQLELRRDGLRLTPLTNLPTQTLEPTVVFGVPIPASHNDQTLSLHAPASIVFELPPTAAAVTFQLRLDPSIPGNALHWPSMIATVSTQPTNATNFTIDADNPEAGITLPITTPNTQLTLTLDPHTRGPVLDRLQLHNAHVLQDEPPTNAPTLRPAPLRSAPVPR